ncbi:MAG: hypothetical protein C4516_06660 [Oxalobacter sp.]|nr:MAG: hypothetical protein C4516_06660 [Oxalobacter sp.]
MKTRRPVTVKQNPSVPRSLRGAASVMDSLRANENLASLMPTVARLVAIQKDCVAASPELFGPCSVLRFDSGELVLTAPNAAMASRVKQKSLPLQQALGRVGWEVSAIRCRVQHITGSTQQILPKNKTGLPPKALMAFADLEKSVEKSPRNEALRSAVNRLINRHSKGST